jgi:hypothetical protein
MDENREDDLREAITRVDDTGLVAGEELITQAETMLPLLQPQGFPREDLHAALPTEHDAHATIDQLHSEVEGPAPDPRSIEQHVGHLRALPELEATIALWWENPNTQRFIANLGQI